jgi:hypothetical protein
MFDTSNNNNNTIYNHQLDSFNNNNNKRNQSQMVNYDSNGIEYDQPINGYLTTTPLPLPQSSILSGIASSTTSSDRALMAKNKKRKFNYLNILLIIAIILLILSLLSTCLTFIFPFWITITIPVVSLPSSVSNSSRNIYIKGDNNITLMALNTSKDIKFELGIWEVKMNQKLSLIDRQKFTTSHNTYPLSQTMVWFNIDPNGINESFLYMFIQFMNIKNSHLFTIQILEIIHFIFTFLSLCFTSVTLCLCSKKNSPLCWYTVCFFMNIVSLAMGLTVIILLALWQRSNKSIFLNYYQIVKTLGWSFWLAVGINSTIVAAGFTIILYIIISLSQQTLSKYSSLKKSKRDDQMSHLNDLRASYNRMMNGIQRPIVGIDNVSLDFNNNNNDISMRIPRIHVENNSSPSAPNMSRDATIIKQNNVNFRLNNEQSLIPADNLRSSSYVFYTGHGNYHNDPLNPENEVTLTPIRQQQQQINNSNEHDHQYFSVTEQQQQKYQQQQQQPTFTKNPNQQQQFKYYSKNY